MANGTGNGTKGNITLRQYVPIAGSTFTEGQIVYQLPGTSYVQGPGISSSYINNGIGSILGRVVENAIDFQGALKATVGVQIAQSNFYMELPTFNSQVSGLSTVFNSAWISNGTYNIITNSNGVCGVDVAYGLGTTGLVRIVEPGTDVKNQPFVGIDPAGTTYPFSWCEVVLAQAQGGAH